MALLMLGKRLQSRCCTSGRGRWFVRVTRVCVGGQVMCYGMSTASDRSVRAGAENCELVRTISHVYNTSDNHTG